MIRLSFLLVLLCTTAFARAEFRAGAFAQDITPAKFPVPVNGSMKGNFAQQVTDPLHARALALHDGKHEIILCVIDACMVPREVCEKAKEIASKKTGVPAANIMISATHTHSATTLAGVFQSDPDPEFVREVPERIAQGLIQAHENLEPAEIGWGKGSDPSQVFNRRWLLLEGESYPNPFGITNDRAQMNPGYLNPKVSKPIGTVDPDVYLLVARGAKDHRPLAVFANYSLHYVGGLPPLSADYFGAFAREIGERLQAGDARYAGKPAFVGIMSNGTSGNINNVNYGGKSPAKREPGEQIKRVAASVASAAMKAYGGIQFKTDVTLASAEQDVQLGVRKPTKEELVRAQQIIDTTPRDKEGQFAAREAIYARESVLIDQYPDTVPVKLQAHRIGDLSIAVIPCEVFVEIGIELKERTPFAGHFTVSLGNGYNGYLPTAEHHALGGYETWRARSSYLEVPAAEKITSTLLALLAKLKP